MHNTIIEIIKMKFFNIPEYILYDNIPLRYSNGNYIEELVVEENKKYTIININKYSIKELGPNIKISKKEYYCQLAIKSIKKYNKQDYNYTKHQIINLCCLCKIK